ncbi:MAG: hypothetical protein ACK4Q5_09080 [Saprospiraceae bacterium]
MCSFFSSFAQGGGEICQELSCGNLGVFIRPIDENSPYYCTGTAQEGYDPCSQKQFEGFLRFNPPTNPPAPGTILDFHLAYKQLSASFQFVATAPGGGTPHSNLVKKVSEGCTNAYWATLLDDALYSFSVEPADGRVTVNFDNFTNEDCGFQPIDFDDGEAHLFTVIVDAYPGETLNFTCGDCLYDRTTANTPDCVDDATNPLHLFACDTEGLPITVSLPADFVEDIRIELGPSTPGPDGSCEVPVWVLNYGPQVTLEDLDFIVNVDNDHLMTVPTAAAGSGATLGGLTPVPVGGQDYFFRITGSATVATNQFPPPTTSQPYVLARIYINKPMNESLGGEAVLSLDPNGTGKIANDPTCRKLTLSNNTQTCTFPGTPPCSENSPLRFVVTPDPTNLNCERMDVLVSAYSVDPNVTSVYLDQIDMSLEFYGGATHRINNISVNGAWPCDNTCGSLDNCATNGTMTVGYCSEGDLPFSFSNGQPKSLAVVFDYGGQGCLNSFAVRRFTVRYAGQTEACAIPDAHISGEGFPICAPEIKGDVQTETGQFVEETSISFSRPYGKYCTTPTPAYITGCETYSVCACQPTEEYELTPAKDGDDLNGVSTYDLLLITKHIVGADTLDSPYKIIAADANKSGSVTGLDVLELRKLILGIYTDLPDNTSWRFVDKAHTFPLPSDPGFWDFPEDITISTPASGTNQADFVGVKVGDVNNNVVIGNCKNSAPLQRKASEEFSFGTAGAGRKTGEVLTFPVTYSGTATDLEAFQFGIRFDPRRIELLTPSQGDLPGVSPQNFGITRAKQGEIRALWFADPVEIDPQLQPGMVLFHLHFRVLGTGRDESPLLAFDDGILAGAVWDKKGQERAARLSERPAPARARADEGATKALQASCRPNPSSGEMWLDVQSPVAQKARLMVFDPFGKLLVHRDLRLEAGAQQIEVPEMPGLPAGVYVWKIITTGKDKQKVKGHFIKQ